MAQEAIHSNTIASDMKLTNEEKRIRNDCRQNIISLLSRNFPNTPFTTNPEWLAIHTKLYSIYFDAFTRNRDPESDLKATKRYKQWIARTIHSFETALRQDDQSYTHYGAPALHNELEQKQPFRDHVVDLLPIESLSNLQLGIHKQALHHTGKTQGICITCNERLTSKEGQFCHNKNCLHPQNNQGKYLQWHDECLIPLNRSQCWVCSVCMVVLAEQKHIFQDTGNRFVSIDNSDVHHKDIFIRCIGQGSINGIKRAFFCCSSVGHANQELYVVVDRPQLYIRSKLNPNFRKCFERWLDMFGRRNNRKSCVWHRESITDFTPTAYQNLSIQTITRKSNGGMRLWMAIDGLFDKDGELMKTIIPFVLGHIFVEAVGNKPAHFIQKAEAQLRNDVDVGAYKGNTKYGMHFINYTYKYGNDPHFKQAMDTKNGDKSHNQFMYGRHYYVLNAIRNALRLSRNKLIRDVLTKAVAEINRLVQHLAATRPHLVAFKDYVITLDGLVAFLGYMTVQEIHVDSPTMGDDEDDEPHWELFMINFLVNAKSIHFEPLLVKESAHQSEDEDDDVSEDESENESKDMSENESVSQLQDEDQYESKVDQYAEGTRFFPTNWSVSELQRCPWLKNGRWVVGPSMKPKKLCFEGGPGKCSGGGSKESELIIRESTAVIAGGFDVLTVPHQAHDIEPHAYTLLGTVRNLSCRVKMEARVFSRECQKKCDVQLLNSRATMRHSTTMRRSDGE